MGQSIVVTEKPSSYPGIVRFETNRAFTGMGHERYVAGEDVWGDRPPDELARRLLAHDAVAAVQINGNVVTVDLNKGYTSAGLQDVIENLYRFYPDEPEGAGAIEGEPPTEKAVEKGDDQAAPEQGAPAELTPAEADDAPAPEHTDAEAEAEPEAEAGS